MYYVYVIINEGGGIYVGYSADVNRRLKEHNRGSNKSTSGHKWRLVYYEAYGSERDARAREAKLKQRGQGKRHLLSRISHSIEESFSELSAR